MLISHLRFSLDWLGGCFAGQLSNQLIGIYKGCVGYLVPLGLSGGAVHPISGCSLGRESRPCSCSCRFEKPVRGGNKRVVRSSSVQESPPAGSGCFLLIGQRTRLRFAGACCVVATPRWHWRLGLLLFCAESMASFPQSYAFLPCERWLTSG